MQFSEARQGVSRQGFAGSCLARSSDAWLSEDMYGMAGMERSYGDALFGDVKCSRVWQGKVLREAMCGNERFGIETRQCDERLGIEELGTAR